MAEQARVLATAKPDVNINNGANSDSTVLFELQHEEDSTTINDNGETAD